MVSRIASFTFVMSVLLFPMMGLAVLVSGPAVPPAVSVQKSMCLTSGLGCGNGPMLLPALSRH